MRKILKEVIRELKPEGFDALYVKKDKTEEEEIAKVKQFNK